MQELTRDEINAFLDEQTVGRLGCQDAATTYVVPLIFAREGEALYVLTMEGRKVHAARRNPSVCFEVDEYDAGSGNWRSVIVQGRYEELAGEDKEKGVAVLTRRYGSRRGSTSTSSAAVSPTVAFRVVIESATGRAMIRPAV